MPLLNRHGVCIYYEVHGHGRPLILTHGYSSSSEMWHGQIDALSKDFQLIIWDMRGHGRSDYPKDPLAYSEAHTCEDIGALLDVVCGQIGTKAIVGGLSLGGYMSMAFYRMYPDRVSALLIIDTGPGFKRDSAREEWNKQALRTADDFDKNGLDSLQYASAERKRAGHRNAQGLALAARGMLTQRDARVYEGLTAIKVPSLVVVGEEDTPFLAASEVMAKKIPNCEKAVIPRAGHAANIDNPEGFMAAVWPFVSKMGGPRANL